MPWNDNRGKHLVHVDEAVFARARADADAWEAARLARAVLEQDVAAFMAGADEQWRASQVAAAKTPFLEDYADESLWDDHAKTIQISRGPLERHTSDRAGTAVWHAVRRLVEDGRAGWGKTVAQVLAELGEEPTALTGPSWAPTREPVMIPAEILALRLAEEPGDGSRRGARPATTLSG